MDDLKGELMCHVHEKRFRACVERNLCPRQLHCFPVILFAFEPASLSDLECLHPDSANWLDSNMIPERTKLGTWLCWTSRIYTFN